MVFSSQPPPQLNAVRRRVTQALAIAATSVFFCSSWAAEGGGSASLIAVGADAANLVGRWVRTDGSYMIEIGRALPDGKLEARYFNPRPINVGRAEWSRKDGHLMAYVELRDTNYPGSNYTLRYAADTKTLMGNYFQAVQGINSNVVFVRQDPANQRAQ